MILRIITETGISFRGPVRKVTFNCVDGLYTVLPRHERAVFLLDEGPAVVETEEGEVHLFFLGRGVARVFPQHADLLVEFFLKEEEVGNGSDKHPSLLRWYERVKSESVWRKILEGRG